VNAIFAQNPWGQLGRGLARCAICADPLPVGESPQRQRLRSWCRRVCDLVIAFVERGADAPDLALEAGRDAVVECVRHSTQLASRPRRCE